MQIFKSTLGDWLGKGVLGWKVECDKRINYISNAWNNLIEEGKGEVLI